MGGLSSLGKELGRGASKAVRETKRVLSSANRELRRVVKSDAFKVAVAAATVYVVGGAMGAWDTPWASVNGSFLSAATPPPPSNGMQTLQTGEVAGLTRMQSAAAPGSIGATGPMAPMTTGGNIVPGSMATQTGVNIAPGGAAPPPADQGLIGGAMGFVKDNPLLSVMGLNTLSSMTSPDQIDMMNKQEQQAKDAEQRQIAEIERREEEQRQRREENLSVGGVNIGMRPVSGLIGSRMRGRQ